MNGNEGARFSRFTLVVILTLALTSVAILAVDSIQWKGIGPGGGGNNAAVAISPADPNIVLMGSDIGGIVRTGDGGTTWSWRNNGLTNPTRFASYNVYWDFAFDPVDPNTVYHGAMKSTDAGLTWN